MPNAAFWSHNPKLLPRLPKRTPSPHWNTTWRTDGACGLQLVVPNVAFWNHKKLAPKWLPRLPNRNPSPHWNTMAVKDRWCLRVPNVAFWIHKKLAPKWLPRLPKRTPSPHRNTMAVKGGCLASLLLHLVFSSLFLALETCFCLSACFRLPYLFCFRLARLHCSLLSSFVCFPLSGSCSLLSSFLAPRWLYCLRWRASPCRRRGRRIMLFLKPKRGWTNKHWVWCLWANQSSCKASPVEVWH